MIAALHAISPSCVRTAPPEAQIPPPSAVPCDEATFELTVELTTVTGPAVAGTPMPPAIAATPPRASLSKIVERSTR